MAALPPDPWKVLGVDKAADKSEIRTAYKKLVLKCHPDKVQDATLKAQKQDEFQKVQSAYELLNDDNERAKYEEQVKLMELRKQAAMMAKNMPNSSASRSSPRHYEIRTAEPRHKTSAMPSGGAKVYAYASRSHEEMPSRIYAFDDGEKHARRTASYEKASFRDEDRREKDDRRRRRDDDEFRIRERLREKEKEVREREEREARKAERKRSEKERDKERKRNVEERHRRYASPYIEDNESEDQQGLPPKSEKKRSPSKKPYEGREREREREKSSASRRPPSPHPETVQPAVPPTSLGQEPEYQDNLERAATYIERSRRQPTFSSSRGSAAAEFYAPPVVPTPPPADPDDEMRAAARAAGRRSSHEASKSREKLPPSKAPFIVDASSPKSGRGIPPQLHKSHTSPLTVPLESSSPPRIGVHRSSTQEYSSSVPQMPPTFSRTQTWAPGGQDRLHEFYAAEDSEDDHHHRRHRRGSRRTRSPESPAVQTYKVVDGTKTTKMDPHYGSSYGESPNSRRYMPAEAYDAPSPSYPGYIKVKEARAYGPADVKYSEVPYNVSYSRDHYNGVYAS
ncbi:hypothetical protein QBC47DRAFT_11361 [Echria macrotheca]|uniref:J domain-containing protein n=1 Tax=Echria macrotheca TaxID=438768 RepID=A0AAJ0BNV7_9PEZI|nr:hypothetical protein QBC47DRAFT_11361 [Echria macrotheca]